MLKATPETDTMFEDLGEISELSLDQQSTPKLVNMSEEDTEIQVTDTEGCVVGVIDLSRHWIRL
ncbi:MAG: hypothetical protein GY854_18805 [Deltaproteobacteria bacterium]|nr:hypothetical protein [Deltaproteobacteria bacterium]